MTTCNTHASARLVALALAPVAFVALVACGKTEGGPGGAPSAVAVPTEARTIAIQATPTASASAPSVASASALASASASAPAPAPASASARAKGAAAGPPLQPASARFSGKNFALEAASPGCRVDTPCTMTLRLTASGGYHVNKEYPYKFVATALPNVQFLGKDDASTFSRASGDFREDGEQSATMTVRFKPTVLGEARVSGTYKMSVCSKENCQIETQPLTLAVPVM